MDRFSSIENTELHEPHSAIHIAPQNVRISTDLTPAEVEDIERMRDDLNGVLPRLPQFVGRSIGGSINRLSDYLGGESQNAIAVIKCFSLVRDVLRLVSKDSSNDRLLLDVYNRLDQLVQKLSAEDAASP